MLACAETSVLIFSMAAEGCIVVSVKVLSHPGHLNLGLFIWKQLDKIRRPVLFPYLTLRGNIVF